MSGIRYCILRNGEDPPDEFCAVRNDNGEPSEYRFYVPESENAKLRDLVCNLYACARRTRCDGCPYIGELCDFEYDLRELGIEMDWNAYGC
jgi:hypothetical protein